MSNVSDKHNVSIFSEKTVKIGLTRMTVSGHFQFTICYHSLV